MNPTILAIISLRSAALAATLAGQVATAAALYALADLAESGVNVDAHMATVAAKLKEREINDADWQDVQARIEADASRLHAD